MLDYREKFNIIRTKDTKNRYRDQFSSNGQHICRDNNILEEFLVKLVGISGFPIQKGTLEIFFRNAYGPP